MQQNLIRAKLIQNIPTNGTRLSSTWPVYTELVGVSGHFDYIEFLGEYAPFTELELENLARAAELHHIGTMIKVDFQNRAYVAQRAVSAGFQAVNFVDHRTADEVRETVRVMKPETPQDGGRFGFPNRRFIGCLPYTDQLQHAQRLRDTVLCFMIEKGEAVDKIESICSVPGVDMVQFGPSDYSMSRGWSRDEHTKDCDDAERRVIEIALKHGVAPRCEINMPEDAEKYVKLGVRHFCLGDQIQVLRRFWEQDGSQMRDLMARL